MLEIKNINDWLIKSSDNIWSEFNGIAELETQVIFNIKLNNGKEIYCTPYHLIKYPNGDFLEACHIQLNDILYNNITVIDISYEEKITKVYSIDDVKNNNEYYSNGLIHHNCAFIRNAETVWGGASSTLSTGGRGIILSTPNGMGNFFHSKWQDAIDGLNGFNPIILDWKVHPERDQAWRDNETKRLGERLASQECLSGDTIITVKDVYTNEIKKITLKELYDNE